MRTKSVTARVALALALTLSGCRDGSDQTTAVEVHEAKGAYADFASWPVISPGSLQLADFRPFRAVYERHYRDGNGVHREDRVIVAAENVAWGPEAAIMVSLADAGSLEYSDTNARNQFRFFSREDGRMLLQVTPAPGTAKDYRVIRAEEERVTTSTVRTASGEVEFQEMAVEAGGWGAPPHWVVASMPLEQGMAIRLDPNLGYPSSRIFLNAPFRVLGQEWVEFVGERFQAWLIEHPVGLDGLRLMRTWVVNHPPYVLGRQSVDADTGEEPLIGSMRLLSFQAFEDSP